MKAAYIEATGPADSIRIGDLITPEPGPGEVLVKVHDVAFNPIDLYLRSGSVAMPMAFPYVVGCDLAGTVVKLGPGAKRYREGQRVWGSNQGLLGRQGTCSELAAVHEDWLYATPDNISNRDAAAMALVGITAHLGLFQYGQLKRDEIVYVPGGSGGVGSMVIQMAKAVGAQVVSCAGAEDRVQLCRDLGADLAFNYKTEDIPARLHEFTSDGVDVWYETQREPNLEMTIPLLRKRGRMILIAGRNARPILPVGLFYPRNCSLFGFAMFNCTPDEQRRAADDISRWASEGKLKSIIGREFSLEQAADAQALLEASSISGSADLHGKVLVHISD